MVAWNIDILNLGTVLQYTVYHTFKVLHVSSHNVYCHTLNYWQQKVGFHLFKYCQMWYDLISCAKVLQKHSSTASVCTAAFCYMEHHKKKSLLLPQSVRAACILNNIHLCRAAAPLQSHSQRARRCSQQHLQATRCRCLCVREYAILITFPRWLSADNTHSFGTAAEAVWRFHFLLSFLSSVCHKEAPLKTEEMAFSLIFQLRHFH